MWILNILLKNLILVLILEISLGILCGARSAAKVLTVAIVNIITNPVVVLTMLTITIFFPQLETFGIIFLEILVVILEGFVYSKYLIFQNKKPYGISLLLNVSTFLAGKILNIIL